jgi:hypothetical protein
MTAASGTPYASIVFYRERIGARIAVRSALKAEGLIPWPKVPPD